MKTLLFIISIGAAFILSQNNKLCHEKQRSTVVSAAYADSVLEASRIERMKNKFMGMQ
jgi:hypothetical protein